MGFGSRMLNSVGVKMSSNSITREALIQELEQSATIVPAEDGKTIMDHSSLTIYSEELVVFLGHQQIQLMRDLTDWYDCQDVWTYRTKNVGTNTVNGVFVNLLGATTPELIQSAFPKEAIGGGLTSRMIFVYEDKKSKSCTFPFLAPEVIPLWDQLVADLEAISMLSGPFRFEESYLLRYGDWYPTAEETGLPEAHFGPYGERRATHVMKLSMVMCASRSDSMILEAQDFDRALGLLEMTEKKMAGAFMGYGKNPMADTTLKVMRYIGANKEVPIHELARVFYQDADKAAMSAILATLEQMGYCRLTTNPDTGRVVVRLILGDVKNA